MSGSPQRETTKRNRQFWGPFWAPIWVHVKNRFWTLLWFSWLSLNKQHTHTHTHLFALPFATPLLSHCQSAQPHLRASIDGIRHARDARCIGLPLLVIWIGGEDSGVVSDVPPAISKRFYSYKGTHSLTLFMVVETNPKA